MPLRGSSEGNEDDQRRFKKRAPERAIEIERKRVQASGERQGKQHGEKAQPSERSQAERRRSGVGATQAFCAQPERIARKPNGKAAGNAAGRDAMGAAAIVQVPE